ncbi:MAG TPA: hypothetical protein VF816_09235 [Rhodocyclaceae bacterium]
MNRGLTLALLLHFAAATAVAQDAAPATPDRDAAHAATEDRTDSHRLEARLQALDWAQFRSVIESIPKLKADVDAYGPAGWEYVKSRYKTYAWRKNIDRLDADEKRRLADLLDRAGGGR